MNASLFAVLLIVAAAAAQRVDSEWVRLGDFGEYKLNHANWTTWTECYKKCVDDGAHLLVLNSQAEFDAAEAWLKPYGINNNFQYGASHFLHNLVLRTIFDTTLEEAGYSKWATYAPDLNYYKNDKFPVVSINLVQDRMYKGLSIANGVDKRPCVCKKSL